LNFTTVYKYNSARRQARTFRKLSSLSVRSSFLFLPFFFFFVCPGRENDDVESRGYEKGGSFSLQDLRRSSIGERVNESGASRSFPNPHCWKIDGDADDESMSPISILPSVRSFLPPAMAKVVHKRARG